MSRPLRVGLQEVRSFQARGERMAAAVAEVTVLRRVAVVTELPQPPDEVPAGDAVEQLPHQPVQCCPRTAVSPRR
jgi:hypothetical protein